MKYYCPYCGIRIKKNQKICKRCNYHFRKTTYNYTDNHSTENLSNNSDFETPVNKKRRRLSFLEIAYIATVTSLVILLVILLYLLASNVFMTLGHHL